MHRHYRNYRSRATTSDPSTPSSFSSRTIAIATESEPSQKENGEPSEPLMMSGLTKTEAEDLLDCLEAAGYGPCQLSYVNGEGFSVRLPFRTKSTARSKP
jgi:hypothetical protein